MTRLGAALIAVTATLAFVGATSAGTINQRKRRQSARIAQGVRTGALTCREAARLRAREAQIHAEEWRYRHNDGQLGPRERADLHRDLNRLSDAIDQQKHDGQQR
jgi:hypothetical protein